MRPPVLRASYEVAADELVVDNFAGGGGASTGIEAALGRPIDIAINHSPEAIAMHTANHPETKHYCENIWEVDPREACSGRRVGLAWFSPDCTHFSRAKGTAPVSKDIRGLAWVVIRWAETVRPRVIILENVEEFQTWGPLGDDNRPDKSRSGETFREWLAKLTELGYQVEFRSLVAADYGTPTTRRRLFLIARCDGLPIVWPEATHGRHRAHAWRPASEIIDWQLACPSIFGRKKPLAEATLRRIAAGIQRYVVGAARPFIAPLTHQGGPRVHNIDEPLRTVTAAHRGELALIEPYIVRHGHYSNKTGAGLREGCGAGTFRGQPLQLPLATVCATNDKHIVCPIITKHYGGVVGHGVERALGTITSKDHHALTAATLTRGADHEHEPDVRAFLLKYYGANDDQAQDLFAPLHTVTTKARFGLVMVHGEPYQIVDIGMRMLQPHELFAAQGFPKSYNLAYDFNGKPPTKTSLTALAGNAVNPPLSEALARASTRGTATEAA